MNSLYFECTNGISGDMSVAALIDLGANTDKLKKAFDSINLYNEFEYEITEKKINSIKTVDFNVKYKEEENHNDNHHHKHRNLNDIIKIINNADITDNAKFLAKKIFNIVAEAEAQVHGKDINDIHFHEVGAVDSIADIIGFSVLYDDICPDRVYFTPLSEGYGNIECAHGIMSVPVPAVCAIASKYEIPLRITKIEGEMITPTGAAIVAALYTGESIPEKFIINKVGIGAGKRPYPNPILRIMSVKDISDN